MKTLVLGRTRNQIVVDPAAQVYRVADASCCLRKDWSLVGHRFDGEVRSVRLHSPALDRERFALLSMLDATTERRAFAAPNELNHRLQIDRQQMINWLLRRAIQVVVFAHGPRSYAERLLAAVATDLRLELRIMNSTDGDAATMVRTA